MRTNFVLIDSENVKPEYIEKLNQEHFRVVVFVGANLKRLDFPVVKAIQSLGSNGQYVQISSHGPSALDFHIAYYIGKLAAAHPDAYFHIISKDKGFDPLIEHLREQKIFCLRSTSVLEIPLVKSTDKLSPKQRATDFYEKHILLGKTRPATVASLQNSVYSHFLKQISQEDIADVVVALKAAGYILQKGKKITYRDCG